MSGQALTPMCFIAMPFGKRTPPAKRKPEIDFNQIHQFIAKGAMQAGLNPIRADFELTGGFIEKPMLERLLVAEYVIADLTFSNPNVLYEVGVRHGASERATILICAQPFVRELPFDVRQLRVIPYALLSDGSFEEKAGDALAGQLRERLGLARAGKLPVDNPLMQVTSWKPAGTIEHSKTDIFLDRIEFTGELGCRIKEALALSNAAEAIEKLAAIEAEVVDLPAEISQVHTALLGVFIGYREKKAYDRMAALFEKFPNELKRTPVAREQYALALNRIAEKSGDFGRAEDLRRRALLALDEIPAESVTSETFGVRGRIYKGWHEALVSSGSNADPDRAAGKLEAAITTYESGFRRDIRDFYPGVNAVTLRLLRGTSEDRNLLPALVAAVRYSVDVAPTPKNDVERYWQTATRLELASAARDWDAARRYKEALLAIDAEPWMFESTAENLERHKRCFAPDAAAVGELTKITAALRAV